MLNIAVTEEDGLISQNFDLQDNSNKIGIFFENEYKEIQKELLQTKGQIYELKYKNDVLK